MGVNTAAPEYARRLAILLEEAEPHVFNFCFSFRCFNYMSKSRDYRVNYRVNSLRMSHINIMCPHLSAMLCDAVRCCAALCIADTHGTAHCLS